MIHNKHFQIMKEFLGDYDKEVYGRGLIKKINVSQKSIALTLKELEEMKVLISKKKGNTKYFSLNKKNVLIKKYLSLLELEKSIKFFERNKKLKHIFSKNFCGDILCIFGSYAKDIQKKNSDLDLFIVGKFDESLIVAEGEKYNLEINIQGSSQKNFRLMVKNKNPLMSEILKNHVLIKGYEKFVEVVI